MADGAQQRSRRFSAFISYNYNSRDRKFARRLHRELENYRLPRRLAHKPATSTGPADRLKPLFRDADEMTAAPDLSEAVREALAESDYLIVVCSPASAASVWVGHEIDLFRALHGDRHILTALIDGAPQSAFHPALRHGPVGDIEPLAADFRPEGGGKRLAMLKLVGALSGVRLDDLIHRDAQRQMQRMVAAGASGLAATVTVATLGVLAYTANADAERRRTETTGLVEYMLTDLRKTMQRTGRLDQLAALNDGAMQYYRNQNLKKLSEAQLRQRAKLLQAMGEDDEKRGKLPEARQSFEDAHRTTAALLAAKPNDPNRIFAHAQSEYWVGFINWRNGDGAAARRGFEAYAALAEKLVRLEPGKPEWQREVGYAQNNLGMLALRQRGDGAIAEQHFKAALATKQALARLSPGDLERQRDVANGHAWIADAKRAQGNLPMALRHRTTERDILLKASDNKSDNFELMNDLLGNELAIARLAADRGQYDIALQQLIQGQRSALNLYNRDKTNMSVLLKKRAFQLFYVKSYIDDSNRNHSFSYIQKQLGDCEYSSDVSDSELSIFCEILLSRIQKSSSKLNIQKRSGSADKYSSEWGIDFSNEAVLPKIQNLR